MKFKLGIAAIALIISAVILLQDRTSAYNDYEDGNFAEAFEKLLPLAEQGDETAQFTLGIMYSRGQGVAQNDIEAVRWYRSSAEQGNASAQNNLARM